METQATTKLLAGEPRNDSVAAGNLHLLFAAMEQKATGFEELLLLWNGLLPSLLALLGAVWVVLHARPSDDSLFEQCGSSLLVQCIPFSQRTNV